MPQYSQMKETLNQAFFVGYMGTTTYYGDCYAYLPLLLFFQDMGVENEEVYGLGRYEVDENEWGIAKGAYPKEKIKNIINEIIDLN